MNYWDRLDLPGFGDAITGRSEEIDDEEAAVEWNDITPMDVDDFQEAWFSRFW